MKYAIYLALPFLSIAFQAEAARNQITNNIAADGLEAACENERLLVRDNGDKIYETSAYSGWSSSTCSDDQRKLSALFNAAKVTSRAIQFEQGNSPLRNFRIAKIDGKVITFSPLAADLPKFECVSDNGDETQQRLRATMHGLVIYESSPYSDLFLITFDGGCSNDLSLARDTFKLAKQFGKLVEFKHSDASPDDFKISQQDDPDKESTRH